MIRIFPLLSGNGMELNDEAQSFWFLFKGTSSTWSNATSEHHILAL